MATKTNKSKTPDTGRADERMWRINQRAHTFADRKKDANRKACRKGGWS